MSRSALGRLRPLLVSNSAPPITGTLAATETGVDAFAGVGTVIVQGSLAVTESGADAFAGVGTVLIQGAFAATETGQDVFTSGGASTSTMFFMF